MTRKQARKFEYYVITDMGDYERGVAGPWKTKAEAIKFRKVIRKAYPVTEAFLVRKIKG